MPTLIRFVTSLLVLAAVIGGAIVYLGVFFDPPIRDRTLTIPSDTFQSD